MKNIYDEIDEHWRAVYAQMHRKTSSRSGFQEMLLQDEAEVRVITTESLQPQLGIFEFGLEWLAGTHVLLSKDGKPGGPIRENAGAAWALIASAVSFGLSIRTLLISGFDTPARALLRTYVETLFLCIAVLHDRTLATAFVTADSDDDVKTFWHTSASPKRLHERIIAIEKKTGFDQNTIEKMTAWRREEYEILSQSSHLSFIAAVMTTLAPHLEGRDMSRALWGWPHDICPARCSTPPRRLGISLE